MGLTSIERSAVAFRTDCVTILLQNRRQSQTADAHRGATQHLTTINAEVLKSVERVLPLRVDLHGDIPGSFQAVSDGGMQMRLQMKGLP
jgi:hypothetical protein